MRTELIEARIGAGLSQEKLAQILEVSTSTVQRWEQEESTPYPRQRPRIANALGLKLTEVNSLLGLATHVSLHDTDTDTETVGGVRARLKMLSQEYDRKPSALLLAEASQCHGQIATFRRQSTRLADQRELISLESHSSILMSKLIWDATQRRDSNTPIDLLARAVSASMEVGDVLTQAHAHMRLSVVHIHGRCDSTKGREHAARAVDLIKSRSPALAGLSSLHAAEACSKLGEARATDLNIRAADQLLNKVEADDPMAGLLSSTQWGRLTGACALHLGQSKRAEQILRTTTESGSQGKSVAIVFGNVGLACLRQKKLEEAAKAVHTAMDIVETTMAGGGINVVFDAGKEMRVWRHVPEIQQVRERMFDLLASE